MKEVENEREQKERKWARLRRKERSKERKSKDNDQRSGLACMSAFCVAIQFLMSCMILCDQEKIDEKRREKKETMCKWLKCWEKRRRTTLRQRERSLREVMEPEIDNGSHCKHHTRLCLLSRASSCMTLA